jgi:hypothetical protein
MKYLMAILILGAVVTVPSMAYTDDGRCGPGEYLCSDSDFSSGLCVPRKGACPPDDSAMPVYKPCDPPCGQGQYCMDTFFGTGVCTADN